jgi:aquaporin Z
MKKLIAELFGTFWLVFDGFGSAVFTTAFPESGIGLTSFGLVFGLTILTMAYVIGPISGAHFNPAVSIGLWVGGKVLAKDYMGCILAQVIGVIAVTGALYLIVPETFDFADITSFSINGYGA